MEEKEYALLAIVMKSKAQVREGNLPARAKVKEAKAKASLRRQAKAGKGAASASLSVASHPVAKRTNHHAGNG